MSVVKSCMFLFCLVLIPWSTWISSGSFNVAVASVTYPFIYQKFNAALHHQSFLDDVYKVKGSNNQVFNIRQVPGDGGCLFHAITASLSFLQTNKHMDFDMKMRKLSLKLRHLAVQILQKRGKVLAMEEGDEIKSEALLKMIADVYEMKPDEYCHEILDPRTWGGGPEIVALSNHFKCPIHVYQLNSERTWLSRFNKPTFQLEICAKFGSPNFDSKQPICLLCADGRFPHISPGSEKPVGDHFLAMFPVSRSVSAAVGDPENSLPMVDTSRTTPAPHCCSGEVAGSGSISRAKGGPWKNRIGAMWPFSRQCSDNSAHTPISSSSSTSTVCLLSDCPVMSRDGTFRDWLATGPDGTFRDLKSPVGATSWLRRIAQVVKYYRSK